MELIEEGRAAEDARLGRAAQAAVLIAHGLGVKISFYDYVGPEWVWRQEQRRRRIEKELARGREHR